MKYAHVSKTFRRSVAKDGSPLTLWDAGTTYNVGRNAAKRQKRAEYKARMAALRSAK